MTRTDDGFALVLVLAALVLLAATASALQIWVPSIAVVIVGALNAYGQHRVHKRVGEVVDEVKTANGATLAQLADRTEGRRVLADIPADQRTTSEQHAAEIIEPNPNDPPAR